jgi:hypothetical protein
MHPEMSDSEKNAITVCQFRAADEGEDMNIPPFTIKTSKLAAGHRDPAAV